MKYLLMLCLGLLLTGCSPAPAPESIPATIPAVTAGPETTVPEPEPYDPVKDLLASMTAEEKVGQLFLARCDDAAALHDITAYHLGGFVLFGGDFEDQTPDTVRDKLNAYQAAARIPMLLAVDEEGGTVCRISQYPAFRDARFPAPRDAYDRGGLAAALINEEEKCQLLSSLGLNVNLGPVCDIATDTSDFMYRRSLGQSPADTGSFVAMTVELMHANGIGSVLKHFPGYGSNADTHVGIAVDSRPMSQLEEYDLIPFAAGIQAGCGAILVSHAIVAALDEDFPASLSPAVHRYLRREMGFEGVILTDDLVMEAITDQYGAGEAAVLAVLAGNDLLCSTDYPVQYEAVLAAVKEGRIDAELLNAAVQRVLQWKQDLGLLEAP